MFCQPTYVACLQLCRHLTSNIRARTSNKCCSLQYITEHFTFSGRKVLIYESYDDPVTSWVLSAITASLWPGSEGNKVQRLHLRLLQCAHRWFLSASLFHLVLQLSDLIVIFSREVTEAAIFWESYLLLSTLLCNTYVFKEQYYNTFPPRICHWFPKSKSPIFSYIRNILWSSLIMAPVTLHHNYLCTYPSPHMDFKFTEGSKCVFLIKSYFRTILRVACQLLLNSLISFIWISMLIEDPPVKVLCLTIKMETEGFMPFML